MRGSFRVVFFILIRVCRLECFFRSSRDVLVWRGEGLDVKEETWDDKVPELLVLSMTPL